MAKAHDKSTKLTHLQAGFCDEVTRNVKAFSLEIMQLCNDFDIHGPMVPALPPKEAQRRLKRFTQLLEEKREQMISLQNREELFGLSVTKFDDLSRIESELTLISGLYSLHARVEQAFLMYSERLWIEISSSIDVMRTTFLELLNELVELPSVLREWPAYNELQTSIEDFLLLLPIVWKLCHPSLRQRHWKQVLSAAGDVASSLDFNPETLKLKDVLTLNLKGVKFEIDEVCSSAKKELEVESKLKDVEERWNDRILQFVDYKDRVNVVLAPKFVLQLMTDVDETIAELKTLSLTKVAAVLADEVECWIAKLSAISEVMENLTHLQTKWTFMDTVFAKEALCEQLPQVSKSNIVCKVCMYI